MQLYFRYGECEFAVAIEKATFVAFIQMLALGSRFWVEA